MEALLYNSLVVIIPIVLSYAIGFCMRLFWEVKLFLGFIILFVLFGIFMHSVVIGAEIALTPNMTWFITFSSFIIWLGYITAPKVADLLMPKPKIYSHRTPLMKLIANMPKLKNSVMKVIIGMIHKIITNGVKTLTASPKIKNLQIKTLAIKKLFLIVFPRKTKC